MLEQAGGILIGKTNLDQFAAGLNGTRSPYGIPTSPFNHDYISGGSSSGSAVVVAAGLVSFALGTDTAGSGRVPAAFNNIIGMKPSKGLISMRGIVPACRTQDSVSIFALTVADAARVATTAIAYDKEDAFARPDPTPFAVKATPKSLRIGIPQGDIPFFGDTHYESLYRAAVALTAELGAKLVPIDFTPFAQAASMLYGGPWVTERLIAVSDLIARNPDGIHPVVRSILLSARENTAAETFEAFYRLADLIASARPEWAKIDAMLLPTAPTTFAIAEMLADPIELNSRLGVYTNFVNLMDLAALAIPAGFRPDGIPFGVTFIGPSLSDATLASIGEALHRSFADARLGATASLLSLAPSIITQPCAFAKTVRMAVVGAHLTGQPLNAQLTERNAILLETTRTARGYSLYALANTSPPKPGLVFDGTGAGEIEVEIWEMGHEAFGSLIALIPAPLGIGMLMLADGRSVQGFLCEAHATRGAEDITHFGGWRPWLSAGPH